MLNEEQKLAVHETSGPVRIIAGVGTGKTYTLTERAGYLIESENIIPQKILILTFTNKAAHELKTRLKNRNHSGVQIMTFHSLAARLLRRFWKQNFSIERTERSAAKFHTINNNIKTTNTNTDIVTAKINGNNGSETLTFDELLEKLLEIWQNSEILKACQNLFSHIMVDEYQDVNEAQIQILKNLSAKHQNICVVGDPDQTIYSWRGADSQTIADFSEIFPNTKTITLTKNYRNPGAILEASEKLISHNKDRFEKNLIPLKDRGIELKLWQSADAWEETEMLMHLMEQYLGSHSSMTDADTMDTGDNNNKHSLGDIAIMCRTQRQSKIIAQKLEKRGYPVERSAPECFWESPEVSQFCDELKSLQNLCEIQAEKTEAEPKFDRNYLQAFSEWLWQKLETFIERQTFSDLKQNRLLSLLNIAVCFDDLPLNEALQAFFDERETSLDADNLGSGNGIGRAMGGNLDRSDSIQLLTLHSSKGLEFPIVIIIGLEEESIPYKKSLVDQYLLEEERRLLYVGMTRALNELHLFSNKKTGKPSRFLREIGNYEIEALPQERASRLKKRKIKQAQASLF